LKNGRRDREYVADLVQSECPERSANAVPVLHDWQQSLVEAEYYIGRLTAPGELVLDPTCGSGTTCFAALKNGRKTLGIEKDPERANVARWRIAGNPGLPAAPDTSGKLAEETAANLAGIVEAPTALEAAKLASVNLSARERQELISWLSGETAEGCSE
jgi:hypothetical protein